MNHLSTTRRLTHTLALLAVISASQLQANETLLLAENGSERTLENGRKLHQEQRAKLAENGSERTLKNGRKLRQEQHVELAENGSERTPQHSRRA